MNLFNKIEDALRDIQHGWTSYAQAEAMAAVIVALRAEVSVEIGVYAGKGTVSLALAHKEIGKGCVHAVDPWSAAASVQGQIGEHENFWGKLDHEMIYREYLKNVDRFNVGPFVKTFRQKSREFTAPQNISVARIDGNHGQEVLIDVERITPNVHSGGVLFLDDFNWPGNAVQIAAGRLKAMGWRELYRIEDTVVFQKV